MRAFMTGIPRISLIVGRLFQSTVSMRSTMSRSSLLRLLDSGVYDPLMI
jgi:hypothetical protein